MWIVKRLNWILKDKIVVYKVTVYYDFIHYGYFMVGSNDRVLGYNLLIRPRVQLYLYSDIKYNYW